MDVFFVMLFFAGLALYAYHNAFYHLSEHIRWKDNEQLMESIIFFLGGIAATIFFLYCLGDLLTHVQQ
jgi:hypothetical protein